MTKDEIQYLFNYDYLEAQRNGFGEPRLKKEFQDIAKKVKTYDEAQTNVFIKMIELKISVEKKEEDIPSSKIAFFSNLVYLFPHFQEPSREAIISYVSNQSLEDEGYDEWARRKERLTISQQIEQFIEMMKYAKYCLSV